MFTQCLFQQQLRMACESNSNVLLLGPTGCGKTTLAKKIHEKGLRKKHPFIQINLATLSEGVLESELFGHDKGAFTGAEKRRLGKLESAQEGTVFLDEIGELPLALQARLLEFMQSKIITPVGSNVQKKLNVRVIAATNKNLRELVKQGKFREDLFYRLQVIAFNLKPLSELNYFGELVHDILSDVCCELNKEVHKINKEVASAFEGYLWPGNLRELKNVLEYAVLSSKGDEIQIRDLPLWFMESNQLLSDKVEQDFARDIYIEGHSYRQIMSSFERDLLKQALIQFNGRVNLTARQLKISKTTLIRRMKSYQLGSSFENIVA